MRLIRDCAEHSGAHPAGSEFTRHGVGTWSGLTFYQVDSFPGIGEVAFLHYNGLQMKWGTNYDQAATVDGGD